MSTEREQQERETGKWLIEQTGMLPDMSNEYARRLWDKIAAVMTDARLKLAGVERERKGGERPCVCGHDKGYHDSITELGHSRGIFCGVPECRGICTGWRPEERRKADRRAESASLKLAAADRLAEQVDRLANMKFPIGGGECPHDEESWYCVCCRTDWDEELAKITAALRSALLEYSRTKV